jgi:hypothetical protein
MSVQESREGKTGNAAGRRRHPPGRARAIGVMHRAEYGVGLLGLTAQQQLRVDARVLEIHAPVEVRSCGAS